MSGAGLARCPEERSESVTRNRSNGSHIDGQAQASTNQFSTQSTQKTVAKKTTINLAEDMISGKGIPEGRRARARIEKQWRDSRTIGAEIVRKIRGVVNGTHEGVREVCGE